MITLMIGGLAGLVGSMTAGATVTAAVGTGMGTTVLGVGGAAAGLGLLAKGTGGTAARTLVTTGVMGCAARGLRESLVKNVFCDIVKPVRGSVLKVDLVGGGLSHTGIYLGNDRIAEVTEVDGRAEVREVSPNEFLSGDSLLRTGAYIYVAAAKKDGEYHPLARESIAQRAESAMGPHGRYNLAFNNCHMFTRYCITGEKHDLPTWTENGIATALRDEFKVNHVSWRSTGDFA